MSGRESKQRIAESDGCAAAVESASSTLVTEYGWIFCGALDRQGLSKKGDTHDSGILQLFASHDPVLSASLGEEWRANLCAFLCTYYRY